MLEDNDMLQHQEQQVIIEDESIPLDLDMPGGSLSPRQQNIDGLQHLEDCSQSNFMMSPPQSHHLADSQYKEMSSVDRHDDQQSLEASQQSSKQRTAAPFAAANMNVMPSSALSQKQFIIKKQGTRGSGAAKRGNSKGASLMKAYFPKLIKTSNTGTAVNDETTPTNASCQQQAVNAGSSGSARQRKYGKMSRSQHANSQTGYGSQSAHHIAQQQRVQAMQLRQGNVTGDVFLPTDLQQNVQQKNGAMDSTSRSLIIADDYQRQAAIGLSQETSNQTQINMPMRKQKSQIRGSDIQQQKVVRRSSFVEQQNNNNGQKQQDTRGMLPPIFSGPQKKNSQKAKALIPVHPQKQYRSQISDTSTPIRYKSETFVANLNSSDRRSMPGALVEPGSGLLMHYPVESGRGSVPMTVSGQDAEILEQDEENGDVGKKVNRIVKKNAEDKLRLMQEQREHEQRKIEDQRTKLLRRQEKLKQNVLRDAQAYKAVKAQRAIEKQEIDRLEGEEQIKLGNMKNQGRGQTSPPRNSVQLGGRFAAGMASPSSTQQNITNLANAAEEDDDKTEEEKAEEKKKLDMMRKFYRNRHSSFLQALVKQKAKKEEDEKMLKEKQEKKKQKVKQKVVGDGSQIRSKLYEPKALHGDDQDNHTTTAANVIVEVPGVLAGLTGKQLNATSKSSKTATTTTKKQIRRGNSVAYFDAISQAERAYNDSTTVASSSGKKKQRQGQGSRGSTRAASSSRATSEKKTLNTAANRSATSFSRGRITHNTPSQKQATKAPVLTTEEQMQFDEKREEEILKDAAEKKARAQAIRDRQEKQLAMIREKVAKKNEKEQAQLDRQKKLQEQARAETLQRAEDIKNMPSLREQQDSRQKKYRDGEENKQVVVASPSKPKQQPLPADSEAFNNFLERNKTNMKTVQLNITDFAQWKKRNRVDADTKVFVINKGGYGDIKRALKQRGWVENKERDSPCFDFLWTLMTKDVQHNQLQPHQMVNHFPTATSITTKVGLTHSLKNLIWFNSVDIDQFYPRCYDLAIREDLDDFIQEFKQVKAVSYIKIFVREMREAFAKSQNSMTEEIKSATVNEKIYKVAMKVCNQRTKELDDLIDDPNGFESLVNDREWLVLSADEHSVESLAAVKHDKWLKTQQDAEEKMKVGKNAPKVTKKKQQTARDKAKATREASKKLVAANQGDDDEDDEDDEYDQESGDEDADVDAVDKDQEYSDDYDDDYGDEVDDVVAEEDAAVPSKTTTKTTRKDKIKAQLDSTEIVRKVKKNTTNQQQVIMPTEGEDIDVVDQNIGEEEVKETAFAKSHQTQKQKNDDIQLGQRYPHFALAVKVLDVLREKYPQFNLDGERNIWIMKPAGSSRGRGICLKKDLVEILDLIKFKDSNQLISNQKNGQLYMAQKYIENTMIMKCRKFDIRQWVLVTDWNPLTIWIYSEPYIRFPAADFDFNKISNRYAHLSNNSIAKYGTKVHITHKIEGNMWDLEQYQDYMRQTYGFDVYEDKIVESVKNIIINSLESVQDNFESKKGLPFEMFGYDIMVDDDFNCWLIEVNSSPAMDYSTDVTERLVKMVLEDTIKVVIDYGMEPSAKKQKKVDTGGFECVYKAKRIVDKPMNSFGLNMEIHGKKIPKPHLKRY